MKTTTYTFLLCSLFLSACTSSHYVSDNFKESTVDHVKVAVLPFEIDYIGKIPAELSEEELLKAQVQESEAYQQSFQSQILACARKRKQEITVKLISNKKVMAVLAENGISTEDSWDMSSDELSELIGVDAIIRGSVRTKRLLTNKQSFGIDMSRKLLDVLRRNNNIPRVNGAIANTADIMVQYDIIDAEEGVVLWSYQCTREADWQRQPEEIIASINRTAAKRFPYRYSFK